jgi:selenocysteine lyase/cysteine desulfurase
MQDLFDKSNFVYYRKNPDAVFFDNASTTHIHDCVLEKVLDYYSGYRASPGRGGYTDVDLATQAVDKARTQVANYLDVAPEQILFTTGATQGLNWIANWNNHLPGNVFISDMEHNSNLVPWLSQGRTHHQGLEVLFHSEGLARCLNQAVRSNDKLGLVSLTTKSNLTGYQPDWQQTLIMAKTFSHITCLDYSQSIMIEPPPMGFLRDNVDYAVFSGHKMFGPTGIGVLYVRDLPEHKPIYGGGGMVSDAGFNGFKLHTGLDVHQAGTPDTAGIIGMGMCCELANWYGERYAERLSEIWHDMTDLGLYDIPDLIYLSDTKNVNNIISVTSDKFHVSDLATLLNEQGVSVRHGKMCAYPYANNLLRYQDDASMLRISTAPYNDYDDCKKLVHAINQSIHTLTQ